MPTFNSIFKNCLNCKKEFRTWPSRIKIGWGKYCSKECMNKSPIFAEQIRKANKNYPHRFKKGQTSWLKGLTAPWAKNLPQKFLKGQKPWNTGKKWPEMSGKNHPNWKGGIIYHNGYIQLFKKKHPQANCQGYVLRSHLTAEKSLNRLIQWGEIIHHINGIRNDDRPENLYLFTSAKEHRKFHSLKVKSELTTNLL